jgi:hypothetical protein
LDPDSAIRKIIQIAAGLDRNLAQSYIKAYATEEDRTNEDQVTARQKSSQIASAYLKIATQLVEKDPNLALVTAEQSLNNGVMPDSLVFLATLRKKNPALANNFFLEALHSCEVRKGNDVNELVLLYAFIFSPLRVPIVTPRGIGVYSLPEYAAQNYAVDAVLAKRYLDVSSRLLLDAGRYLPGNLEQLTVGVVGDFYFLSLIESSTGEYLPNAAQSISEQRNVLANYLRGDDRSVAISAVERWNKTSTEVNAVGAGSSASVDYLVARAEQSSNPKVKNQLFFSAALAAVGDKQDERAAELASKLSPEYGDQAGQLLRFAIAERKVRNGQLDEAEQLARKDDVLVRRCYIFTLIADSLVKGKARDFPRASQLLDEVQQLAQRLTNKEERLSVLEGIAAVYFRLEPGRAFELLRETIQTANKLDDFTGYLSIPQTLDVGGYFFDFSIYDKEFSYFDLIERLGAGNFYQTIQGVREIENRPLRIHSIVVVCKAALAAG